MSDTMKAVRVHRYGGPDELRLDRVPMPTPGPGQVLIRVHAAGVNFVESTVRSGLYPGAEMVGLSLPFIPGSEVAGTVAAVGEGCTRWQVGDRVCALIGYQGGYAEYVVCGEQVPVELPARMGFAQVLPLVSQGVTAFLALTETQLDLVGKNVLVHGGSSGVGGFLIQLARIFGARHVVASSRTISKFEHLRSIGVHAVVDSRDSNWPQHVLDATEGRGVSAVIDLVGASVGPQSLACMAPRSTYVVAGHLGGSIAQFDLMHGFQMMAGNHRLAYVGLPPDCMSRDPHRLELPMKALMTYASDGRIRGDLAQAFSFERASDAHRAIEQPERFGKIYFEGVPS